MSPPGGENVAKGFCDAPPSVWEVLCRVRDLPPSCGDVPRRVGPVLFGLRGAIPGFCDVLPRGGDVPPGFCDAIPRDCDVPRRVWELIPRVYDIPLGFCDVLIASARCFLASAQRSNAFCDIFLSNGDSAPLSQTIGRSRSVISRSLSWIRRRTGS